MRFHNLDQRTMNTFSSRSCLLLMFLGNGYFSVHGKSHEISMDMIRLNFGRTTKEQLLNPLNIVSGNVSVARALSGNGYHEVVRVSDLVVGDDVKGLDEFLRPTNDCNVVSIHRQSVETLSDTEFVGNGTSILLASEIELSRSEDRAAGPGLGYALLSTCPFIQEENTGKFFTTLDGMLPLPSNGPSSFKKLNLENYMEIYEWSVQVEALSGTIKQGPPSPRPFTWRDGRISIIQKLMKAISLSVDNVGLADGLLLLAEIGNAGLMELKAALEHQYPGHSLPKDSTLLRSSFRHLFKRVHN